MVGNLDNTGLFEQLEDDKKQIAKEEEDNPYCEKCGACGEDGCCPPTMCEAVKCKYGPGYVQDYKRMRDQWDIMYKGLNKLKEEGNKTAEDILDELDKSWD